MSLTKHESHIAIAALRRRTPHYTFEQMRIVLEHAALLKTAGREAEKIFAGLRDFVFSPGDELHVIDSELAIAKVRPERRASRQQRKPARREEWRPVARLPLFETSDVEPSALMVH